jgi:1-acyl-sn-glycerol-3-phosphate acyltransferase
MFYSLARFFLWIYFVIYHRLRVRGMAELDKFLASLPPGRSVILASNHESYLDPPAVGVAFPRRLRFIAWEGLFKVPILAPLIRALGAVPVSQENKNSAAGLLREVIGFLDGGYSVLIFPEGERTQDGTLKPLEGGVALIASKTLAPIVPIWIDGAWEAFPIHYRFPRPRKLTLTFGDPIFPGDLPADMPERERRRMLLVSLNAALERMRDAQKGKD